MSRDRASTAKPISTANRIFLHGVTIVLSAVIFTVATSALGLPGICALWPILGVSRFLSWLLSNRPEVPARAWIGTAAAYFVVAPVISGFVHQILS